MKKRIISLCLVVALLTTLFVVPQNKEVKAEDTFDYTMTELYADPDNKGTVIEGKKVSISSLEELKLFQKYVNEGYNTTCGSFALTEDIYLSPYTFDYDDASQRFGVYYDGKFEVALDPVDGLYYEGYSSEVSIDYTVKGENFETIGSQENWLHGEFDGAGHTIHGWFIRPLRFQDKVHNFIYCSDNEVKNLNFEDVLIDTTNVSYFDVSVILGCSAVGYGNYHGLLDNCHVKNIYGVSGPGNYISGVCFQSCREMVNCSADVTFACQTTSGYVAAIAYGTAGKVIDCTAKGNIFSVGNDVYNGVSDDGIGGISATSSSCEFINCCNYVDISVRSTVIGGIVAESQDEDVGGKIIDCTNYGDLTAMTSQKMLNDLTNPSSNLSKEQAFQFPFKGVGGIVGHAQFLYIEGCKNRGNINAYLSCGGICGTSGSSTSQSAFNEINSCENSGNVSCYSHVAPYIQLCYAGGIVGYNFAWNNGYKSAIYNCCNTGKVSAINRVSPGESIAGGIIARVEEYASVQNNYNCGDICVFAEEAGAESSEIGSIETAEKKESCGQIAGEVEAGELYYNYGTKESKVLLCGIKTGGMTGNNYYVTQPQLIGTEPDELIGISVNASVSTLSAALNNWLQNKGEGELNFIELGNVTSFMWKNGINGPELERIVEVQPIATTPASPAVTPTPTMTPTLPMTPRPTVAATVKPTSTQKVTVIASPSVKPTVSPAVIPTMTPRPTVAATVNLISTAKSTSTAEPASTAKSVARSTDNLDINVTNVPMPAHNKPNKIKKLRLASDNNGNVKLTWSAVKGADGYILKRAKKKTGIYQSIAIIKSNKKTYVDRKTKACSNYFYKICAYNTDETGRNRGAYSAVKKIYVKNEAPVFVLTKKMTTDGEDYISLKIKSYSGKFVDIWVKNGDKSYEKLPLTENSIQKSKRTFNLRYSIRAISMCFKLQTYSKKNKMNTYSYFSKVKRIKIK